MVALLGKSEPSCVACFHAFMFCPLFLLALGRKSIDISIYQFLLMMTRQRLNDIILYCNNFIKADIRALYQDEQIANCNRQLDRYHQESMSV